LLYCADVESTKALQDQVLSVDGPKSDVVDSVEVKRLKDEMTSMKKKLWVSRTLVGVCFLFEQVVLQLPNSTSFAEFKPTETLSFVIVALRNHGMN